MTGCTPTPELPLCAIVAPESGTTIELGGHPVTYTLRRTPRRRTISLLIDDRGLRVAAPLRAPQKAIDALLQAHAAWVIRKVRDWQEKRPPPRRWIPGEQIMLRGAPVTLQVCAGIGTPRLEGRHLLFDPRPAPGIIESRIHAWLKQQAFPDFVRRCTDFSAQLGLPPPALRLSNARTRWGSCHASGRISMNWRLIQVPPAWIDYVAAHEVAHLRQMNHSPAFWNIVAALVSDHAQRRAALRREAHRYLLL